MNRVSFNVSTFEANESDGVLEVILTLERPENNINEVTVTVSTMDLLTPDSAKGAVYIHAYMYVHVLYMYIRICTSIQIV